MRNDLHVVVSHNSIAQWNADFLGRTIHSAENVFGSLMLMQMQIWLHSWGKCLSSFIYSIWQGIEHIASVWTQCSPSSPQDVPPAFRMPLHQSLVCPLPYLLDACYCLQWQYWMNCLPKMGWTKYASFSLVILNKLLLNTLGSSA